MGAMKRVVEEGRAKRADKREERKRGRTVQASADLMQLDWRRVAALCQVMAAHDGAVRIGRTRDGGAIALGMYRDADYATEYIRMSADIQRELDDIALAWLEDCIQEYWDACTALGIG